MDPLKELGANLKAARKRAGLEQAEVAERLGVHEVTISNWERGHREPDEATIAQLAELYGLPRAVVRYGEDGGVAQFIARLQAFLARETEPSPSSSSRPVRARGGLAEPTPASRRGGGQRA